MNERKEFRVNEWLTLKLKKKKTYLYVNGQLFRQCMRLLIHIPPEKIKDYETINSIDEAALVYSESRIREEISYEKRCEITPEEEFWGHCSNLQAWVEHDYDTRLLHSNLSFPLLRILAKLGDQKAKGMYKEEVIQRLLGGNPNLLTFLLDKRYLSPFSKEEIQYLGEEVLHIAQKKKYKVRFPLLKRLADLEVANTRETYKAEFIRKASQNVEEGLKLLSEEEVYLQCFSEQELNSIADNIFLRFQKQNREDPLPFPFLLRLLELGCKKARSAYKEEMIKKSREDEESLMNFLFKEKYTTFFSGEEKSALYKRLLEPVNEGDIELLAQILYRWFIKKHPEEKIVYTLKRIKKLDLIELLDCEDKFDTILSLISIFSLSALNELHKVGEHRTIIVDEVISTKDMHSFIWYCEEIVRGGEPKFVKSLTTKLNERVKSEVDDLEELFVNLLEYNLFHILDTQVLQNLKIKEITFKGVDWKDMPLFDIPENFGSIASLEKISVDYVNRVRSFPKSIAELSNLKVLDLRLADCLRSLPESILNLKNLQKVILPRDALTFEIINLLVQHEGLNELVYVLKPEIDKFLFNLVEFKEIFTLNEIVLFVALTQGIVFDFYEREYYIPFEIFDLFIGKLSELKKKKEVTQLNKICTTFLDAFYTIMTKIKRLEFFKGRKILNLLYNKYGTSLSQFHKALTIETFKLKDPKKFVHFYQLRWYRMLTKKDLKELLKDEELKILPKLKTSLQENIEEYEYLWRERHYYDMAYHLKLFFYYLHSVMR